MTFTSELTVKEIEGMQMGSDLMIAGAAWVSTGRSETMMKSIEDATYGDDPQEATEKKVKGLINYLMEDRHGSPFEHGALTIYFHHPIFVEREWVRHRIGQSLNEESARYTQLKPVFYHRPMEAPHFKVDNWKPGKPKFLTIDEMAKVMEEEQACNFDAARAELIFIYNRKIERSKMVCEIAYQAYEQNLEAGFDPGSAREVLPVQFMTSGWRTLNPRSIMHFLSLRVGTDEAKFRSYPLWEINQQALQLEEIFKKYWPLTHEAFVKHGRVCP